MGPNLIALAIPLFFVGIGIELLVAKRRGLGLFRLGDALADLGCGVLQQLVSNVIGGALSLVAYEWVLSHRLMDVPSGWISWGVAFFGVELAYYWWHRLSHEVNILWAAHVVHHHSEDYNLAVALRQSATTWATSLPFWLPLALIGLPTVPFAVVLGLTTLYQFWIHTQLIQPLGWFEKIFNSPSLHRVHHAINPHYLDRNHGATLILFDRLFGTYEPEREPCVYGTTQPLKSINPAWAQVERYVELVRLSARAPSFFEGAKVFFASPAWRPGWMGAVEEREPSQKYDVDASGKTKLYVVVQFGLVVVATFLFLMFALEVELVWRLSLAGWIALGATTLPGLIEQRAWARPLEIARWVAAAGLVFVAAMHFIG